MITLPGYRIVDTVIEADTWDLYKAFSMQDKAIVCIKKDTKSTNYAQRKAEVLHDFYMAKQLTSNYVLKPLQRKNHGGDIYIVMEPFSGRTLMDWYENSKPTVKDLIAIALRIAHALGTIHQERVIHKSIHPQNILIASQGNGIKITGFYQSTTLSSELPHPNVSPYQIKDHIAYMSPEQTGKMNRSLDYRTDLYALGVVLYEMLTGDLPFQTDHPAEMIHAHLTKLPIDPSSITTKIPVMLSTIIMKLLEKMPETRYQSAFGLKEDLAICLNQLNQTGTIVPFILQQKDKASVYERPSELFGREEASKQLLEGFYRIKEGGTEFLLVPGPSGIGKTVLINELHKPLVKEKGYFISGKFMHLNKEIPYAPIIHAFQILLRQILSEGEASTAKWRSRLIEELDTYTAVIVNFIPEIKWLIGSQAEQSDFPPEGIHNRFRQAIRRFIGVFAKGDHPLVLFLDDLQWADSATLDLIHYLLINPNNQHLLIIGAYRDNEIFVGHPFEAMLERLKQEKVQITKIPIQPLTKKHIKEWVSETLSLTKMDTSYVEKLVYHITQGNPFFIVQLFQSFHDEGVIGYHQDTTEWRIDTVALKQISMSDSIIDFILKRMGKLPIHTIKILQLASCFGNQFDLKSLVTISEKSYHEVADNLWHGLEEGLVLPLDASYKWIYPNEDISLLDKHPPTYRFLHDKVQQAFYTSLSKTEREAYHLMIGLQLLNNYTKKEREAYIFDIVNHLNLSRNLLSRQKQLELVEWNWKAGEKAKYRAATDAALHYFHIGYELLSDVKWKEQYYAITYKIMIGLGEAQYLNQQFDLAENTLNETLHYATSIQDKLRIYDLKITLYTHIHQVEKATEAGLEGLQLINWNFKRNPSKYDITKEYLLTKLALKRKERHLLNLPEVANKTVHSMMRTLINTNAPTYHVNQNLATILMLRALRLTLKHGDMDVTALVYNNYALMMSAGFNDYDASYYFANLAIKHTEKYSDNSLKARVYFVFGSFVNHWKNHINGNIYYLERSQQLCIESGNLHLAGANSSFIGLILFIKGEHLLDVKAGIQRQLEFARRNEYILSNDFLDEVVDWINVLSSKYSEVNWEFAEFTNDPSATIIHYTIRLQMTYLFQNKQEAIAIMKKLDRLVDDNLILVIVPDYYFYDALWTVRLIRDGQLSKQKGKAIVKKRLAKLKMWSTHGEANYLHKFLLVKAELTSIKDANDKSIYLYNQASNFAKQNGYIQDAALANLCAGHYYLNRDLPKSAMAYMVEAYQYFMDWGAVNVALQISQGHPELFAERQKEMPIMQMEKESLNVNAIFEAASVISREIKWNRLLQQLMNLVVKNAGAEKAFLILNYPGELKLAAAYEEEKVSIYEKTKSIDGQKNFSVSLVHYVASSMEPVVLGEAFKKGGFLNDNYIKENQVRSILAIPIVYQQKLTGVLYIENNKASYVFTQDSIVLLTLLASQAAISIENAYLYGSLEAKVEERTNLLHKANQNLIQANDSLAKSKEMRRKLLSNISHDLRSPIATIQSYVNAILDGTVDEDEKKLSYLQVIKKRLFSLNRLVQDLFDLAQLEAGNLDFSMEIVSLRQLFKHLCHLFELDVTQAGLRYQWNFNTMPEQELLVEVDVKRIEQVMTNLVANAIKHTKKGEIRIRLTVIDKQAIITVEDEGSGIPASEIAYVFERFYTNNSDKQMRGHGLGLSISKEIINCHKGEIWVESEEGVGSKFHFSLNVF
ncbi:ATP-binding sensor histidine kinase [Virgibacillus sp. M23]|uniref:sensor histidine kinase n=1 Tax=Virgibacillus sp. M23 TaxID=3079030 RepID=UPI002A91093A|nr:ATP-binding sensor histidine kinase [Virgibacillus sp. M23]MDY7044647.1 ATP-binding sensor histidine kinase [Virgibacillus sp. M23]